ncbi:hypothetical protein TRIATDRAFT_256069 [Trichoderma atroviride IMI 206040]|uniref:Uncharacterized protein n=1 Tax=Hypocrea atroviridis (strain ATCC 20476 / IMI 206040) TaxID=452589 RepID=G9NNZ1_HYPAI|nr:uncharacterized protein TRIATDRAFT_256069 [Trichoderma atroviride IMI 206040]EHK47779.1 hypothetical protein TRIATDRAFT_256069 [Trichoderma atroviride IMI 206040]
MQLPASKIKSVLFFISLRATQSIISPSAAAQHHGDSSRANCFFIYLTVDKVLMSPNTNASIAL